MFTSSDCLMCASFCECKKRRRGDDLSRMEQLRYKSFNGVRRSCIRRTVQGVEGAEATKRRTFPVSSQTIRQNFTSAKKSAYFVRAQEEGIEQLMKDAP